MSRIPAATALAAAMLAASASAATPPADAAARQAVPIGHDAADPGSVGVRLVDIPAHAADDPRAREYVIDDLAPGVTIHRRIEVANTTNAPLQLQVYPDAAHIARGAFVGEPGQTVSDLTSWTTLSQNALALPVNSTAYDTVTIAVPRDAAPGERYGEIWAQVTSHAGGNITLVNRVGIRIYLNVGGNNPPASDFTVDAITAVRSRSRTTVLATVRAQVHNTGGRALDMTGTLQLSKVNGALSAGPYPVQMGTTLAPGQTTAVQIPVTDPVPDGPWTATLDLHSGLLEKSFQARITFPDSPGTIVQAATHPAGRPTHRALVYALAGALLLLGAALAYAVVRRRRGTRATPGPGPDNTATD